MKAQHIDGHTRLVGLLGNPVGHSLSPLIHNHAFRLLGLPFAYVPLPVSGEQLYIATNALRAFSFAGANVTIPHKQRIVPYCDVLSPLSTLTGTVNTLYFRDGLLHGTTTDAEGFFRTLAWMGHDLSGGRMAIIGNGGVARTLAFACAQSRLPRSLTIIGRNYANVAALASEVTQRTGYTADCASLTEAAGKQFIRESTLLVNCTSVGMFSSVDAMPLDASVLHAGITVFDTIYNPAQTQLLAAARRAGCPTQNGLRMLLYQGLASFTYWTGVEADEALFDIDALQQRTMLNAADNPQEQAP